jgi:hypothetical protein
MVDQGDSGPALTSEASICPWCSASYTGEPDTCPSCGAALAVDPATDPALPGLTAIDAAAIVRAKAPVARSRNRFLSWISGDYPEDVPSPVEAGALAPPDAEVRREMLRLELAAEVANLQAEAEALIAEATLEGRAPDPALTAVAAVGDPEGSPEDGPRNDAVAVSPEPTAMADVEDRPGV